MKLSFWMTLSFLFMTSINQARQVTGNGEAAFFDSTATCDAIRIRMTSVSPPSAGTGYFGWLGADNDTVFIKLGQLTVQGIGTVSFVYRDNSARNLLSTNKKLLITRETIPFAATIPSLNAVVFADSLSGPGVPPSSSALAHIRDCLCSFPNTYQSLGLALVFKIDSTDYVMHAGFARDGAVGNNVGNARTHSDHVYDFILGHLTGLVSGNTSVVSHTDPVGYGFRRYWDVGTHDSTLGGAGHLGGAGYHVSLALNAPDATPQMRKEGSSALATIINTFGAKNDSGLAWKVTDRALRIITGNYVTGSLVTEGDPFYQLTLNFFHGTAGISDTNSATGGVLQAYHHLQRMAVFVLHPSSSTSVVDPSPSVKTPRTFSLYQNYPNPFNPSTDIRFEIGAPSNVWVTIYNMLGQEVARLIDGQKFPPGVYNTRWSGAPASGVYICRLQALDFAGAVRYSSVRRMILLR